MRKFVVLTTQRSGSTWVIDMLNSHPAITAYGELFLRPAFTTPHWGTDQNDLRWTTFWDNERRKGRGAWQKPLACFRYLDWIFSSGGAEDQAVGFKLMYSQARRNALGILSYLSLKRASVIHLARQNVLDVILSEEAILVRNLPHTYDDVKQVPVFLEPSTLVRRLSWKERKVRWAAAGVSLLGLPTLNVAYESLLDGSTRFEDLLEFLGIESPQALHSPLKKLNRGTHAELIANYDEVCQTLTNTRFAALLH